MKSIVSVGSICIRGNYNLIYNVCKITYVLNSDDSFNYTFEPNYSVISLLDQSIFQGIPGLNLDLKEKIYIRDNIVPTFISERVPSSNREDYFELLKEVDMDYMDPILYLSKVKKQYSGDKLFVIKYQEKKQVNIDPSNITINNSSYIKCILENICMGDNVFINNQIIDDSNRKLIYDILFSIYERSYEKNKKLQSSGIALAKEKGKYKGRKPINVDEMKFLSLLEKVNKKEISPKEASKQLNISIDKYYRLKAQLQK